MKRLKPIALAAAFTLGLNCPLMTSGFTLTKDAKGNMVVTTKLPNGDTSTQITNPQGVVISRSVRDAEGVSTITNYRPNGSISSSTKDAKGKLLGWTEIDPKGNHARLVFDSDGTYILQQTNIINNTKVYSVERFDNTVGKKIEGESEAELNAKADKLNSKFPLVSNRPRVQ